MNNEVLKNYLLHLVPAFAIPIGLYLLDDSIPLTALFKIWLLFPLLLLAVKGLTVYFAPGNLRDRSIGRILEYAVLQGMVYAAFIVLFIGFAQPYLQLTTLATLRQFLIGSVAMTVSNILMALNQQKKLRNS
ncbi:hypothetical protein HGP16_28425 [Rhizobium sp. P40RR-XXII]|uniref:hypothetical protein n=1 Tax=unclassified Rhizobium TaxID=2613769 RepID=UPI001456FA8C|nr:MULTISPECIES: hypothetical protein [unclassified Rhizobium]NLR89430.1 hypothetical protein [Rhizobium sp. P28RR-XV]NLS20456.1 hypothetical protein [Rhizobium sp. P40RR-XXII]